MEKDLKDFTKVPFERIYLDPNNPRVAPPTPPGYDEPEKILSPDVQRDLRAKIPDAYGSGSIANLQEAVEAQGWVPIDAMIVWELATKKGYYVVVEGNTRFLVLTQIREKLEKERKKLATWDEDTPPGLSSDDIEKHREMVARLEQIVADTQMLTVAPVNAATPVELKQRLPRLMGVRHINHAREWLPFATNLYVLMLYRAEWEQEHPGKEVKLDDNLIKSVAAMISEGPTRTRRSIQSSTALSHFMAQFEDRLPPGESFRPSDQYFFSQILGSDYARRQFGFDKNDLRLSDEMEEVLFKWAFARPRSGKDGNPNILQRAEDFGDWNQMKKYDDSKGTSFASRLSVDEPDEAQPFREVWAEYLTHRARSQPVDMLTKSLDTLTNLIQQLDQMRAGTFRSQASHLRPLLEQIIDISQEYIKMVDAVSDDTTNNRAVNTDASAAVVAI